MNTKQSLEDRVNQLIAWYGDGKDGSSPTAEQWRRLIGRATDAPVTFVNFFKMREQARYTEAAQGPAAPESGEDAFSRYASVSVPTVEKVGGKFLLLAPFEASFIGTEEDWDLIAVGAFPNAEAALALYENPDYRGVYPLRSAGCARQRVVMCAA